MVVTSSVSLITHAGEKSRKSPSISITVSGNVSGVYYSYENTPSYSKWSVRMDFSKPGTQARHVAYRANLNGQELARSTGLSDTESKLTEVNQELKAVRKEFEEYKATNEAKLEAMEQRMSQKRHAEDSGLEGPAAKARGPIDQPKESSDLTTKAQEPKEPKECSDLVTKPESPATEAVRKKFEEYKATNDAKLEALEQRMAQMAVGARKRSDSELSGSLDEFNMSNFGSEAGESVDLDESKEESDE
ncbi:unnamed protein product [Caenorhabditis brenneri]